MSDHLSTIQIRGARQHNLKNLDIDIQRNQLTVITGPSGSGKSSLAFHTLYAEGQRRYVETFSPYVRQFLDRMDKPEVDRIDNIPPAIAIEQKNTIRTTRSTVGTLTELNDYLKIIYPKIAQAFDPETGERIQPDTTDSICDWVFSHCSNTPILVLFSIHVPKNATTTEIYPFLSQQGFLRILKQGNVIRTDQKGNDSIWDSDHATIIQDRISVSLTHKKRLREAVESALHFGKGNCSIQFTNAKKETNVKLFSNQWINPNTGFSLPSPSAALFSFNSPLGACSQCRGFGRIIGIDLQKSIQNPSLSIQQGVIKPFEGERGAECKEDLIRCAKTKGININTPWHLLSETDQEWVLKGEKGDADTLWKQKQWYGVRGFFEWMETKAYKMHVRVFLSRYRAYTECPTCRGTRLKQSALCFKIKGKTLPDLWHMPLTNLKQWFDELISEDSHSLLKNSSSLRHSLHEIQSRLHYLNDVGLGYLTLDRPARTLSGGEIERVNLTTCLGASLTNTLFVLDEPTVGLHARDIHRLIKVIQNLRDKGNTIVVVEHEEAVIRSADEIIDIGPAAGEAGGNITYQGPPQPHNDSTNSITLPYLTGEKSLSTPKKRRTSQKKLTFSGAHKHNIQNQNISLPIGNFICLTGVSGSGKSTMANDIIYLNLQKAFLQNIEEEPAFIQSLKGIEHITGVELVDQSPLTKTPRSTPAVYAGAFDAIRELFALTEDASLKNLKAGYFSFNAGEGRCERCFGNGFEKVEMQFLSDLFITCPECNGSRYQSSALDIKFQQKSIADVLNLTITEALTFFGINPDEPKSKTRTLKTKIQSSLQPLVEVGLGYLRLGQPLNTLSGGESQRIKLCQLLTKAHQTTHSGKLLILDEPTTGLHFIDIEKLLDVFQSLVNAGHTLLIIEHNLDVIRAADHLIEMGPNAGSQGGQVVFEGTPEAILKTHTETSQALQIQVENSPPPKTSPTKHENSIRLSGARERNLKNIDLIIPRDELVVVTGLSGSGKSTLAFGIIFAEGQRRFLDSMSPYARQFAGQLEKPDIDSIEGLPPTVAIEQRISRGGGKSTVGTVTEIFHFLRLLYAKLGTQHCPESKEPVVSQTTEAILKQLNSVFKTNKQSLLLAPLVRARKGYHTDIATKAQRQGITSLLVDGKRIDTEAFQPLARYKEHDIFAIIHEGSTPSLKVLEQALTKGNGQCALATPHANNSWNIQTLSKARVSPVTGVSFPELDPHHFSFNSPRGWCSECRGYGSITTSTKKPKKRRRAQEFNSTMEAEIAEEMHHNNESSVRIPCPSCQGERLNINARFVFIHHHNIASISKLSVTDAIQELEQWQFKGRDAVIARDILPEITQRLRFLEKVGLNYLSLDRSADTLSGGESQRIRLAAQLGSNLTGVLYVLDEPTIGLHPRDNQQLLNTLEELKNKGNSLLVVEHDDETMRRATQIIDLGPKAGIHGGTVVANTTGKASTLKKTLKAFPESPTLQSLSHPIQHPILGKRRSIPKVQTKDNWLKINGCCYNNLKNINVRIPLERLTVITGVSGCGKSSLLRGTLPHAVKENHMPHLFTSATGFQHIKHCYEVDQSPIGKTSRSCPATYVKILDEIRKLFAAVPESKMRGYTASRFSFNNTEGQCPECKGNGKIKLEMDFLPTTWTSCQSCNEQRYNEATLEVFYKGKTIGDILEMSITDASTFFEHHPKLHRTLSLLHDTGLGYLKLGQASPTLSGGEAQRLKLVAELTKGRKTIQTLRPQKSNLYLIEEPTIGLHQKDVRKLIEVLHKLVDEGHTVVVIEHHTAIMAEADYLIDMGPEAGDQGGTIVAQGSPERVALNKHSKTAPFIQHALKK